MYRHVRKFAAASFWSRHAKSQVNKTMRLNLSGKCPVMGSIADDNKPTSNADWWPNQVNLKVLNQKGNDPTSETQHYAEEFASLDLEAVRADIFKVMTTSEDWWPADYGHYGPFMIRMAWHSAGTYRIFDGRGGANSGNLRFAPLNSWPDNANLDKAKRLLWPIKKKYGKKLSWADLMVFAGNCAIESMGLKPFGFAGGREDIWQPEEDVDWGIEETWLANNKRYSDSPDAATTLNEPLGAVQMGLIYVNPQGPGGNSDPLASAHDIRETFRRMAMNDEETVALIAGGHTFGKAHGAGDADKHVGPEPEGASVEEQGFGWTSSLGSGKGVDTITSGLEGAWTKTPTKWDNNYFENLFEYEWEKSTSPGGATQWKPTDSSADSTVPDAHDSSKSHAPVMFTTDLALREDPEYYKISKRFYENPDQFADTFARAWYKLTHRDMGPHERCLGAEVPPPQLWQDPVPPSNSAATIGQSEVETLKSELLNSGLSIAQLVRTAWASASTYRHTDHRGGANGARIALEPQKSWAVNDPTQLSHVLQTLESIRDKFNASSGKQVSLADLIVLGGCAAIEEAAKKGGHSVNVPFLPGRTDALQDETDQESFAVLEPKVDGFRNFIGEGKWARSAEEMLVDRAHLLSLSAPEMTVLLGGLRTLNANSGDSNLGILTTTPEVLSNDFFVNLLDMGTEWSPADTDNQTFAGKCRDSGRNQWHSSRVDLLFGSNSQLRALAEYYACDDSQEVFVKDFVAAWSKVMDLDRF